MSNQPATYITYLHPTEGPAVVKQGFSWPGAIFGFIWAFVKRLPAAGAGLLAVEVLHILSQIYTDFGAVTGVLNVGVHVLIGAYGNRWRQAYLEQKGYVRQGWLRAETWEAALPMFHHSLAQASVDQLDEKISRMADKMDHMTALIENLQQQIAAGVSHDAALTTVAEAARLEAPAPAPPLLTSHAGPGEARPEVVLSAEREGEKPTS
ncbi:DUF2628 domain-containing protein [Acanthopleuribacter pedis]|uniref:DUF2628 domain-containing protein n=1 Tax=Acanthopleuribacter pedis TaxID=442870 RepID=A0A8J7QBH7_9BACT|nr:DUF2628 domain-containing protein [Acanthopleuribacter pedis]MBO1321402.1 DUF2628 domain-containing protein [Acanthopleuribacter pedis]